MLDKFWGSIGTDLAGKWAQYIFGPALVFWAGGLGMYMLRKGWSSSWNWLNALPAPQQAILVCAGLLVLVSSSLLVHHLRLVILRLLEGYWPRPLDCLAGWLAELRNKRVKSAELQLVELKNQEGKEALSLLELRRMARLELRLHYAPANESDGQPTAMGNILRSGETAPGHKYGLDAVICWPRLWLLLPDAARQDLSAAREALLQLVELWAWGALFLFWNTLSLWALPVGLIWMGMAYKISLPAAMVYADLIEAAFDLHRWELYKAVHWPLPDKPGHTEVLMGKQLTEFLWRGNSETPSTYSQPGNDCSPLREI